MRLAHSTERQSGLILVGDERRRKSAQLERSNVCFRQLELAPKLTRVSDPRFGHFGFTISLAGQDCCNSLLYLSSLDPTASKWCDVECEHLFEWNAMAGMNVLTTDRPCTSL